MTQGIDTESQVLEIIDVYREPEFDSFVVPALLIFVVVVIVILLLL